MTDKPEYAKGVKGEIDQRPKRFYKDVGVVADGDVWRVTLDGKALRTPNGNALVLPTDALAQVIADEWRGQVERIDILSMFNTRLAHVAIDRAGRAPGEMAAEAARYAETDLVSHLAEAPASLRDRQQAGWGPLRSWAAEEMGVRLKPVEGIMAQAQPEESLAAMRDHALSIDAYRLAGLVHGVSLLGSAVLGLAVERGRIGAAEAYELSRIDEQFQIERWGEDDEAIRRTERHRAEARALDLWFRSLL
ncbi:MAG TPA: ATP12 family protein [Hyphomonadaceae bacterium]|nr:ATP12 family protein [Hyphomonadaceae bacterium]HPN07297.1 ATP12 family protein [Hyphomonadaceae bacterium]